MSARYHFPHTADERRMRQACEEADAPGNCKDCPVLVCGMARVAVSENAEQNPREYLEDVLADYLAFLLMTAEGLPTGLDIEGFSDRRMWPEHPIMKLVADIIDFS